MKLDWRHHNRRVHRYVQPFLESCLVGPDDRQVPMINRKKDILDLADYLRRFGVEIEIQTLQKGGEHGLSEERGQGQGQQVRRQTH